MGMGPSKKVLLLTACTAAVLTGSQVGCGGSTANLLSAKDAAQTEQTRTNESRPTDQGGQSSQTHKAGESFDLVGEPYETAADGAQISPMPWEYAKLWDWTGTMRVSVSPLTIYGSGEEAGFPDAQGDLEDGEKLAVFEINIQNIDAVCRQAIIDENGASNFNLSTFVLERADGTPIESRYFAGPRLDGMTLYNGSDGSNRSWVEQGNTVTFRIACIVPADADKDAEYKVDCCGAVDPGAPSVYLGKAAFA